MMLKDNLYLLLKMNKVDDDQLLIVAVAVVVVVVEHQTVQV